MAPLEIGILITFVIYVALFAIFRLESRIAIAAGLGLLVATAITLAIGKDDLANQIAIYAFYFLGAGVILLLIQHVRRAPRDKLDEWIASGHSLVVREIERVSGRRTYNAARAAERRFELMTGARFQTKDQMMRAKAVQDELRKRSEGWEGTEEVRKWRNEKIQVLDASVIVNWFSEGENTEKALEIRQRILDDEMKVVIPDLALYEMANALRNNPDFGEDDVVAAVESVKDMGLEIPISSLTKAAGELASRHKISLYDAFYVALAEEIGADFITADKGLYESIKQLGFVKFIGHVDESKGAED